MNTINIYAIRALYMAEMARTRRTLMQNVISPVISTTLYLIVFGTALGSQIKHINGVSYGSFIVPGLILLSLQTQSVASASYAIYFPRFTGAIFELLAAPVSFLEIVAAYVGASATKSMTLALVTLGTASLLVPLHILHPLWMVILLFLAAVTFSLLGLVIGIWANGFEKLQVISPLILSPLTFLGGSFYSINVLPPAWRYISMFNPIVYLVGGFRWSFYGYEEIHITATLGVIAAALVILVSIIAWMFRTGYRLRQ